MKHNSKNNRQPLQIGLIILIFVVYLFFSPYLKNSSDTSDISDTSETYSEQIQSKAEVSSEAVSSGSTEHAVVSPFSEGFSLDDIPDYSGEAYVIINDNVPYFSDGEMEAEPYESFSELDELGRCGPSKRISPGISGTAETRCFIV